MSDNRRHAVKYAKRQRNIEDDLEWLMKKTFEMTEQPLKAQNKRSKPPSQ